MSDTTDYEPPEGYGSLVLQQNFVIVLPTGSTRRQTVSFVLARCLRCYALVDPNDTDAHRAAPHLKIEE